MRARVLRGSGLLALLAGCIHGGGPPSVAPSGKLVPRADEEGPRTAAEFAVVFSGPTGTLAAREDAIVTVLFNRAMRSLDDAEDANVPAATVRSKDGKAINGRFRWVGTRGLIFEPASGMLPAATEIEVTVPVGTKAADGAALAREHKFAFDTPRPQVVWASFGGRNDLTPDGALRIQLNQRIEPADAQSQIKLLAKTKTGAKAISFTARRATGLPAAVAGATLELVPIEKLPLDTPVEVVLSKGFKASEGPLGTLAEHVIHARTYGPIRLADIRCSKQALGRCLANHEIAAVLSTPVARKELLAHLSVQNGEPAKLLVAKNAPPVSTHQVVVAQPTPGKKYKITIRKGLKDTFGQVLDKDLVFEVATEAAWVGGPKDDGKKKDEPPPPDGTPEDEPVIAGVPKPIPGAPHRPKLDFQAQIGLRGTVVEANANFGIKSHKVPVGVVNLPTVGLWSGKLQDADVLRWLGEAHTNAPTGSPWAWEWWTTGAAENVRAVKTFDLDLLTGGKGAALLSVAVPGETVPFDASLVTVTDLAVSARMSKFGGLVWVTRLSNGQPVANASVRIVRLHPTKKLQAEAFTGTTDASGLLTIPAESYDPMGKASEAVAIVKAGDDWTWNRVEHGKAALTSWWDVDLSAQATYKALLFTERGVYRPGETIKLAGVVRKGSAKGLEAPAGKDVKLRVSDGEGNEILATRGKLDAFGTFSVDVPLTKTAKLGSGTITAQIGTSDSIASTSFLLAAYKASAFKIGVEPGKSSYVHGDVAKIATSGEYLYGAVMAGARLHAEVTRAPVFFEPPKSEAYVFGDVDPRGYVASYVERVDDGLDDKGKNEHELKLDLQGQNGPERVTFEAEVIDTTKQTVAKAASFLVHPAEFYLGLERGGSRFVNLAGGSLEVKPKVAAIEPNGAHRAGVNVTIELVQRKWSSSVAEQPDGSPSTWSKPKDEVVGTCTAATSATAGATCAIVVKEPGYYFVKARAKDPRGNDAKVGTTIWVVAEEGKAAAPTVAKTDLKVVQLEADKQVYKPGEKAKILVHNPFPTTKEVSALVTVERGGVLSKEIVTLKGAMPVVEIPVKSEWFPNAFVSIDVVRGRIKLPPAKGVDLGGPEFRVGTTEIKIDPESHRLKLAIAPTKTKLSPGETFDADVAVTDDAGKPQKASITFYAVDEGVLMLTGYKTPDPLPPFAERQKLAVFGFDSREHLAHVLSMKAGEKVPILGWEYPNKDGWEKGSEYGDGGGGEGSTPRMDFRATAFFEAGHVTTDDGHAKFHVKLPDNLTSYRLMAVAATGDDRFGFGETNITASKKLMIRPALPRALRVGDAFEASMVLTTKELPATDVEVSLKATGLAIDGPTSFHAQVGPGQQIPVRFKVRATAPGNASLDVEAKGGGATDRVVLARTVAIPTSMKSVAAYGSTTSAQAVDLGIEGVRPDEGGLKVKVASSALVGLDSSFDRLIEYPYGCTEQLVSRALPLLTLQGLGKQAGVRMPAKTDALIDDAIAKTVGHQDYSGGFGFWEDDAPVPWLSAYATLMLEEAGKRGHSVPKESRDRAVSYLRQTLAASIPAPDGSKDDKDDDTAVEDDVAGPIVLLSPIDQNGLKFANAAIIADALAVSGVPDPGSLNRLYDVRGKKPVFAQAFLLHAMAVAKMPQAQLQTFAKELEDRLKVDANTATAMPEGPVYAPMLDSAARSTALVLRALLAVDGKNPLAPRLVRGLLDARVDGAWRSTQENVWALMALDAYRSAQEKVDAAFEAKVFVGDTELGHAALKGVQEEAFFLAAGKLPKSGPLTVSMEGQGKLFWSAELRYATTVLPQKPLDHGFFVEKRVRGIAPGDLDAALKVLPKASAGSAKVGQLVLVDLLFETAEARDQVVIDDPLPAGVEPLDLKLEIVAKSQDVGDGPFVAHATGKKSGFLTPSLHREHHDDRVLTFLGHVDPGLYHFRYVARATSTGTFVVPPTTVEAMYAPEVNGRTRATTFTVTRE